MIEFNKVIITGHLASPPKLSADGKGHQFCKGALLNRRTWTTPDSIEHEEVNTINWIAWGKVAELLADQAAEGDEILLEGKIKTESWQGRTDTVIVASAYQLFNHAQN